MIRPPITLQEILVTPTPALVPGYAVNQIMGGDSNFRFHTFAETIHNSGITDIGNNAFLDKITGSGRINGDIRPTVEVPAVAPTSRASGGSAPGPAGERMLTGPATSPLNMFYGKLALPQKLTGS